MAQAGERFSAAELQQVVPGATVKGTVAEGGTFEGTYHPDGTMEIRTDTDSDTGTWVLEGDTICLTWQKWRKGERYCIYWEREPDGLVARFTDGRLSTRFEVVK